MLHYFSLEFCNVTNLLAVKKGRTTKDEAKMPLQELRVVKNLNNILQLEWLNIDISMTSFFYTA